MMMMMMMLTTTTTTMMMMKLLNNNIIATTFKFLFNNSCFLISILDKTQNAKILIGFLSWKICYAFNSVKNL